MGQLFRLLDDGSLSDAVSAPRKPLKLRHQRRIYFSRALFASLSLRLCQSICRPYLAP